MATKIDGDAAIYDLDLVRGADGSYKLVFTDDAGVAIDLTGYTVTVKAHLYDVDGLLVFEAEAEVLDQVTNPGEATFDIGADDFTAQNSNPAGVTTWVWSATLTGGGKVRVPVAGRWKIFARPIASP